MRTIPRIMFAADECIQNMIDNNINQTESSCQLIRYYNHSI
jgi:hypothetical protein